jgi:redox-sensitive bicupin YhaK (pirin superfamily)
MTASSTQQVASDQVRHGRNIERVITGQAVMDGAGVKINRLLTQTLQRRLDPFLMLDAFGSDKANDYIAGFPEHPHRGFETVSYMITGRMRHKDSAGNEGLLSSGGLQWMTAGRGVIHSEMPEQADGVMEGFQLWLNLPAEDKMCQPWYRDFPDEQVPRFVTEIGVTVKVIAGHSHGVNGTVQRSVTEPVFLDITLRPGTSFSTQLPEAHNAFFYTLRGAVGVNGKPVPLMRMAILETVAGTDGVTLEAAADAIEDARVILIAGHPLGEPIAQHGPFVMNTQAELVTAMNDFRAGRLGE